MNGQNYARAAALYEQACRGGHDPGCTNLGFLYEKGLGVRQDYGGAAGLYERACQGGHALGCTNLGVLYEEGRGVVQGDARAAALYERACQGGHAPGCTNLGVLYQFGRGVVQDHARAAGLYERACEGSHAPGCNNLGVHYERGLGVRQDYGRAAGRYEQACQGGFAPACTSLGVLYEKGLGVQQDHRRAITLFEGAVEALGRAHELAPEDPWIEVYRGRAIRSLALTRDSSELLALSTRVLASSLMAIDGAQERPDLAGAWGDLGAGLAPAGRLHAAKEALDVAHRLDPDDGMVAVMRGAVIGDLGLETGSQNLLNESLRILEESVSRVPDDGHAWWNLSVAQERLGLFEASKRSMEQAIQLGYDDRTNLHQRR